MHIYMCVCVIYICMCGICVCAYEIQVGLLFATSNHLGDALLSLGIRHFFPHPLHSARLLTDGLASRRLLLPLSGSAMFKVHALGLFGRTNSVFESLARGAFVPNAVNFARFASNMSS